MNVGDAYMDRLPDEVLEVVFSYLSTQEVLAVCARVCERWAALASRVRLEVPARRPPALHAALRALHVRVLSHELRALMEAAARLPLLEHLTVEATAPLQRRHVAALALLPRLRHLDVFVRPALLDETLLPVARRLTSLVVNETVRPPLMRRLALDSRLEALHMFGRSLHYSRRDLVTLLQARAAHLTDLTLRCNELEEAQYEAIGACENLTSLRLYSCWLLTSSSVVHVTKPRKLRCLHVSGARLVRQKALTVFLERLPPVLEELSLSASWFSDNHIAALVQSAPSVRVLELWRCHLTAEGLLEMCAHLPQLHTLDLDLKITAEQIRSLSRYPRLRNLRCVWEGCSSATQCVGALQLVATHARYPRKYFRSGGEGYRSSLFYYWTLGVPLRPLSHHLPPCLQDDDDEL